MNIDASVKYLEYIKLKMRLLMMCMNLLPKWAYRKCELFLNKETFHRKPYVFRTILFVLYSIFILLIYIGLVIFMPKVFSGEALLVYMAEIAFLSIVVALYQLKTGFFDYFAHDHFFNVLNEKQSEFIMRRIQFVFNGILFQVMIPLILPVFIHFVFFFHIYYMIFIIPLFILFIYQFIKFFGVVFWYVNVLIRKILLLNLLFIFLKFLMSTLSILGLSFAFWVFAATFKNGAKIDLHSQLFENICLLTLITLFVVNIVLYIFRGIPNSIVKESYKKIIYNEGYKKKDKKKDKTGFLTKLLSFGMINCDEKEQVIYQKDLKHLLRRQNGPLTIYLIGILLTVILSAFALTVTIEGITEVFVSMEVALIKVYFFLNFMMALALGYFLLLHKHISSYSAEGVNHNIYNRLQVNFYKVFKAKYYFNRYLVFAPFLPFFLISAFGIRSFEDVILYTNILLYFVGMSSLVIRLTLFEDFNNPIFNGVQYGDYYMNKVSKVNTFYGYFLFYAFLIFPFATQQLLDRMDITLIADVILVLIYLLNIIFYFKSLKLKHAKGISYGGVLNDSSK